MKLLPGPNGWPQAYEYSAAGSTVRFDQNAVLPPILHLTFFNPLDDHYGQSPLEAAAIAVDTHNAAACWNKALLDNAARPCGALAYAGTDGRQLVAVQYEPLRKGIRGLVSRADQCGPPACARRWARLAADVLVSARHGFPEAKHAAAREIALAFGVPPMLLGIPGDNTYSNYQEANRDHVLSVRVYPCCRSPGALGCALTHWLAPVFGEYLRVLGRHRSRCEALSADRGDAMGTRRRRAVPQRRMKNVSPRVTDRLKAEMCSNSPTRNKHWALGRFVAEASS